MPNFQLNQGDAVDFLKTLSNESIDLIVTDPPYESLEKHRKVGTTTRLKNSKSSSNNWFKIFPNSRFPELFSEFYRVLKKDRHFYMMCDQETLFVARPIGEEAGFKFKKFLIWDKVSIGMGYSYRYRHECIMFFSKGKRKLNDLSIPDILTFKRVYKGYPTEKPVGLCEVLITQSTQEGEVVLDPFMGSGSAGAGAVKNGRHFLGNDLNPESIELTKSRLVEAGAEEGLELVSEWKGPKRLGFLRK